MSADILKSELKQDVLRPLYHITGSEPYLKYFYLDGIRSKALGDGDASFDVAEFDGQNADPSEFLGSIGAFPVTAPRKTVIMTDAVYSSEAVTALIENADLLSDACTVIFFDASGRTEKKDEATKRFRTFIDTYGLRVEADKPERRVLEAWIAKKLRAADTTIDRDTLDYLIASVGDDMFTLHNELSKLCAFCDGTVTKEAIDSVCVKTEEARTFDLSDAILSGDAAKAYAVLAVLIDLGTEPNLIAGAVFGAVSNLYKVKLLISENASVSDIASRLGMKEYPARKIAAIASKKDTETVRAMLAGCAAADLEMKRGVGASDPYTSLIKLTAVLCAS